MYETVRSQLPPELAEAIDRAAAETTTEDVTLEQTLLALRSR